MKGKSASHIKIKKKHTKNEQMKEKYSAPPQLEEWYEKKKRKIKNVQQNAIKHFHYYLFITPSKLMYNSIVIYLYRRFFLSSKHKFMQRLRLVTFLILDIFRYVTTSLIIFQTQHWCLISPVVLSHIGEIVYMICLCTSVLHRGTNISSIQINPTQ